MAYSAPGVYVEEVPSKSAPIAGVGTSTAGFIGIWGDPPPADPKNPAPAGSLDPNAVKAGTVVLCTNFSEFKRSFGDFSSDPGQNQLAHAAFGFFNNGGTRCYVVHADSEANLQTQVLDKFEAIDEIAIVAAPGVTSAASVNAIITHCAKPQLRDRFAILDSPRGADPSMLPPLPGGQNNSGYPNSDFAALYYPWIIVFDPASKANKTVAPSGHLAGLYARVDADRGVHKAPANETVFGALGVDIDISRAKQEGLNPQGVNCIRNLNGNIRVWGARTLGGDANLDVKYIHVRRLLNFLRKSIDRGTQWTVFEPNNQDLWAKVSRNVSAFLSTVWQAGALFGSTPEQAFYVKCDAETNPPEIRDQGKLVCDIGVAIVKPAEFVIFHLSQWAGLAK